MCIVSDAQNAQGVRKVGVAVSLDGWVLCDGRLCLPLDRLDDGQDVCAEAAEAALVVGCRAIDPEALHTSERTHA